MHCFNGDAMNNKRKFFCAFAVMMINSGFAMENDQNNQQLTGLEWVISCFPTKESIEQSYDTAYKILQPLAVSIYTTTKIQFSDDEAFKKLGYPIDDKEAQEEMKRNLDNYKRFMDLKKQLFESNVDFKEKNVSDIYNNLNCFIERRKAYIERAAACLPNRLDGIALAQHCLKYHDNGDVMTAPTKNIISGFISSKERSQNEAHAIFVVSQKDDVK